MNPIDLSPLQLKRAAAIKEQIEKLNRELHSILGDSTGSAPRLNKTRTMSASVKRKIAAAQKARWANLRRASPAAARSPKPAKRKVSAATRAKLRAKLKAHWAAKRAGKK